MTTPHPPVTPETAATTCGAMIHFILEVPGMLDRFLDHIADHGHGEDPQIRIMADTITPLLMAVHALVAPDCEEPILAPVDATHECPGPGCTERCEFSILACPRHWRHVPKFMQAKINRAWRDGDLQEHARLRPLAVGYMRP